MIRVHSLIVVLVVSSSAALAYSSAIDDTNLLHHQCRNHPTWRFDIDSNQDEDSEELCSVAENFYLEHDEVYDGARDEFLNGEDWMDIMEACMERKSQNKTIDNTIVPREPEILQLYPSADRPVMATVSFALSEQEVQTVLDLKQCVQEHYPGQFEHRSFAYEGMKESVEARGGNDATFLAGFLQLFAPGVASQIYHVGHTVWKAAGWGEIGNNIKDNSTEDTHGIPFPDPYDCGIRTSEHLSYDGWGGLGKHGDSESLYTILVSLSDPSDYDGGEYYMEPSPWKHSGARIVLKPNRLSAVVFLSEENHGVQKILKGHREMFTTEIWKYGDVALGRLRPLISDYERFLETGSYEKEADDVSKEDEEVNDEL